MSPEAVGICRSSELLLITHGVFGTESESILVKTCLSEERSQVVMEDSVFVFFDHSRTEDDGELL